MSLPLLGNPVSGTSTALDQLFAAPELSPVTTRAAIVPGDPLEACLEGRLPPGRMPRLDRERSHGHRSTTAGPRAYRGDLKTVNRYLQQTCPYPEGLGQALQLVARSVYSAVLTGALAKSSTVERLLDTARDLSICFDARESLTTLHLQLQEYRGAGDDWFRNGLDRFEQFLRKFDECLNRPGLREGGESLDGQVEALYVRAQEATSYASQLVRAASAMHADVMNTRA
ncbi:hypothetical protein [Roseateles sp. L2-2]|uniref:hypothetical protein n=1 Tax=Roseateles TaxID=93681 RepID=UPI003D35AC22